MSTTEGFVPPSGSGPSGRNGGGSIEVKKIPVAPKPVEKNVFSVIVPVLLVAAVVGMVAFFVTSGGWGSGGGIGTMLLPIMALFMVGSMLMMNMQRRAGGESPTEMAKEYLGDLDETRDEANRLAEIQYSIDWSRHPDPSALASMTRTGRMWERFESDPTRFLAVRLGVGATALDVEWKVEENAREEDLEVVSAMGWRDLLNNTKEIPNTPRVYSFAAQPGLALFADDRAAAQAVARAAVMQVETWHSPDDVLVIVISDDRDAWEWTKWSAHSHHPTRKDAIGPIRMLYPTVEAFRADWDSELQRRGEFTLPKKGGDSTIPADPYLFIVGDMGTMNWSSVIPPLGVGRTAFLDLSSHTDGPMAQTPKTVMLLRETKLMVPTRMGGEELFAVEADTATVGTAHAFGRAISRWRPTTRASQLLDGAQRISPDLRHLLDIPDLVDIDFAKLRRRFTGRNRLKLPYAVDYDTGRPVTLDLREPADHQGRGPHGMVIGMTGSGKTELLKTLYTIIVMTQPTEMCQIFAGDFKYDVAFPQFKALPHNLGMVSNTDQDKNKAYRFAEVMLGEHKRRSTMLGEVGAKDAREWNRRRAGGEDLPAMPALVCFFDEFPEMLNEWPDLGEFMARIVKLTRATWIHIIAAAQEVSHSHVGKIDKQLKFRICLKVEDMDTSSTVLNNRWAQEMDDEPGAGFMRVNQDIVHFKSCYVGGMFTPRRRPRRTSVIDGEVVTGDGAPGRLFTSREVEAAAQVEEVDVAEELAPLELPVIETIVDQLLALKEPRFHEIWLPELSETRSVEGLVGLDWRERYGNPEELLSFPYGVEDEPAAHAQHILRARTLRNNVGIAGSTSSGRSTAVQTLIASAALTHTPDQVQFYVIALSTSMMGLADLPHVGSVAGAAESELIRRTLAEVEDIGRQRERRWSMHGVADMEDYRRRRDTQPEIDDGFGDVYLVIDNFNRLYTSMMDEYEAVLALSEWCIGYGIHLVLTADSWLDYRKAADRLGVMIELKMNNTQHTEMGREPTMLRDKQAPFGQANVPDDTPGRGVSERGLQMAMAVPTLDTGLPVSSEQTIPASLLELVAAVREVTGRRRARAVRKLPSTVSVHELVAQAGPEYSSRNRKILLGMRETDLLGAQIDLSPGGDEHLVVMASDGWGRSTTMRTVTRGVLDAFAPEEALIYVVDPRRKLSSAIDPARLAGYATTNDQLKAMCAEIGALLQPRLPQEGLSLTERMVSSRRWDGPEIILIGDDLNLMETPANDMFMGADNAWQGVVQYVQRSAEVGLHVLAATSASRYMTIEGDPLLGPIVTGATPMLLGSTPADLGLIRDKLRAGPLPQGRGWLFNSSSGSRVALQVAVSDTE
ncbi:type VII secretion protein EccCb [Tsukamurella hominis]|uniref:type VII secretion protein EccCb n=1 Tax=Tsukamurella hominis TaxID=1970232 RepID=UPI0039E962CF